MNRRLQLYARLFLATSLTIVLNIDLDIKRRCGCLWHLSTRIRIIKHFIHKVFCYTMRKTKVLKWKNYSTVLIVLVLLLFVSRLWRRKKVGGRVRNSGSVFCDSRPKIWWTTYVSIMICLREYSTPHEIVFDHASNRHDGLICLLSWI